MAEIVAAVVTCVVEVIAEVVVAAAEVVIEAVFWVASWPFGGSASDRRREE